jgi:serine/threonine protein kinase
MTNDLFRKTLRRLQSTCSNRGVLPQSHLIPSESLLKRGDAIASGAFADVHEAELDGKKVCIKALRSYIQDTGGITKKVRSFPSGSFRQWSPKHPGRQAFYREVIVWKSLKHPNIVPFLGVPTKVPPPFEIVCEWMENSRITEYVRENPNVDRINLVSGFSSTVTTSFERQILQLWDVADGLHYLHSRDVIHGDLKGVSHSILHSRFSRSQILI